MTLSIEELQKRADAIADIPRTIKIDEARKRWGLASKGAAFHVMKLLEAYGYVKHIQTGDEKGEWILEE